MKWHNFVVHYLVIFWAKVNSKTVKPRVYKLVAKQDFTCIDIDTNFKSKARYLKFNTAFIGAKFMTLRDVYWFH